MLEAHEDHANNYKSDGIKKGKGTRYASDYFRVQFVVQNVPEKAVVLDVGCNSGCIGVPLTKKGCHVQGIDIQPDLVKRAQSFGIFAEVGVAEDLSRYKDESFDVVVCSEVLEHLYDPMEAIKEAKRVLRPNGLYIITVPHPAGKMCADGNLGDYHQQNFTFDILNTLFHSQFEKGKVSFRDITYIPEYCNANGYDPEQPQWVGAVAQK